MQTTLFDDIGIIAKFPSTRYQGSKLRYVDWIWHCVKDIPFDTVLDAFGGTSAVAFRFKQEGKEVTYNDGLKFNYTIGKALIENDEYTIGDYELEQLLIYQDGVVYPNFIEHTFGDIYFTDDENCWLDMVTTNIINIENEYKRAIAFFALFQSCIIKRPYNLFHRKNLYIRTQEVKRSFGNKTTWDTPFPQHFRQFIKEANVAVFCNNRANRSINLDVFNVLNCYDLVYIDSPYISDSGVGVNYSDFYHFLEGLVNYDEWNEMIDYESKHKRLKVVTDDWVNPMKIESAFERLIERFKESALVISYRSDGIPSIDKIITILERYGKSVRLHQSKDKKYVLSKKQSTEVLIVAI